MHTPRQNINEFGFSTDSTDFSPGEIEVGFPESCTDQFTNFNTAIRQLASMAVQSCYIGCSTDYSCTFASGAAITSSEIVFYRLSISGYTRCNGGGEFYPSISAVLMNSSY